MSERNSKVIVEQLAEASRKLAEARDTVHGVMSRNLIVAVETTLRGSGINRGEAESLAGELYRQGGGVRDSVTEALVAVAAAIQTIEESVRRINKATQSSGSVTFRME
jgi:hypothetical protein